MKPKPINVLSAFAWFYIGAEKFERVCDIYELDISPMCTDGDVCASLETSLHQCLVDAAVVCGRTQLAERLINQQQAATNGLALPGMRSLEKALEVVKLTLLRWNAIVSYWVVLIF